MQLWNQGNSVGFRLVIGLGAEYSASAPIVPQGTTASGAGGTMVPMGGPSAPERRAEVSEKCGVCTENLSSAVVVVKSAKNGV